MSQTGYDVKLDRERLEDQLHDILGSMLLASAADKWLTLREIWQLKEGRYGESSISAQLRNLRKAPYRYKVEKRRRGEPGRGCWEYKVSKPFCDQREGLLFEASAVQERA
jgi:hypothetical protein